MAKAIIILSGGMDSVTLLHDLAARGVECYGLTFDYGQRHRKELAYAHYCGKKLCAMHKTVSLGAIKSIISSSVLTGKGDIPKQHYTHANQKLTVVPNRNMVMLSIAVAWAENLKIKEVYFGPHANDNAIYPDCRPRFVEVLSMAAQLGTYSQVKIYAPYVHIRKSDIAARGHLLGVDYSRTWSCYEGKKLHCGKCGTCQERKEAFINSHVPDPTIYRQ